MRKVQKIGHRGAKGHVAENTLESIQKALDLGVDMIEIDVHVCASGEIFVIHDETLDRTTNGKGEIVFKTASEINQLRIDDQFRIPMLQEVLDLLSGKCKLNIELKGIRTAGPVFRLIQKNIKRGSWKKEDLLISSFSNKELIAFRKLDSEIPIAILEEENITEAIALAKQLNAVAIHPFYQIISAEDVQEIHELGFRINVWTVNDLEEMRKMMNYGVDGIISDYPDLLLNIATS